MTNNWVLTYEHDQAGNHVNGSLADLRAAIHEGADVKVLYSLQPGTTWSRLCPHVVVRDNGKEPLISATVMEVADTNQQSFGLDFSTAPFALEYHIYNTSGVRILVKVDHETHQVIDEQRANLAMRWFTRR